MIFLSLRFFQNKQTNEFDFTKYNDTSGRLVFVQFLEEIEDTKKTFEINRPLVEITYVSGGLYW